MEMQLVIGLLSLASAVIGLWGTLAGRRQVIVVPGQQPMSAPSEAAPSPAPVMGPAPAGSIWYDNPGWILFWLVFFWPIGVYALGRCRLLSGSWKKAILFGLGALFLLAMLG